MDANLPESFFADPTMGGAFVSSSSQKPIDWPSATVDELLHLLQDPQYREQALTFLNKKRGTERELAVQIKNSFNTVFLLISEVTSIYKSLTPEKLISRDATRVCNALALLQCLASHPDTKKFFLDVRVPHYLYPFLKTTETGKSFQFLRLTSLGAIGALLKNGDPIAPLAVHFFLETELFPMCLRCIELGDVLTQTVATFIVSKILMQDEGLQYCCGFAERFFSVMQVFTGVIEKMGNEPSPRLLKNLIHCYLRMSEAPRACDALRRHLPPQLRTTTFINALREDPASMQKLKHLFYNVTTGCWADPETIEDILGPLQYATQNLLIA